MLPSLPKLSKQPNLFPMTSFPTLALMDTLVRATILAIKVSLITPFHTVGVCDSRKPVLRPQYIRYTNQQQFFPTLKRLSLPMSHLLSHLHSSRRHSTTSTQAPTILASLTQKNILDPSYSSRLHLPLSAMAGGSSTLQDIL